MEPAYTVSSPGYLKSESQNSNGIKASFMSSLKCYIKPLVDGNNNEQDYSKVFSGLQINIASFIGHLGGWTRKPVIKITSCCVCA